MSDMFVGVTDNQWFSFLERLQPDEVNYWKPGGKSFKALQPGDLFFFKLHAPVNKVVGYGVFVRFSVLPLRLAWEAFGEKNGVGSLEGFIQRISRYRKDNEPNPMIGCIILAQPVFLDRAQWIDQPADWAGSIVVGKGYEADAEQGRRLFQFAERSSQLRAASAGEPVLPSFTSRMQHVRLGQGGFRVVVTEAYQRRCAISGERTLPVLEAAHIRPVSKSGPHDIRNGLLLRSDLHILLDDGLLTVTDDYRVEVSRRIKEQYENGRDYYKYHGEQLALLPKSDSEQPIAEYLRWHNENVYRG